MEPRFRSRSHLRGSVVSPCSQGAKGPARGLIPALMALLSHQAQSPPAIKASSPQRAEFKALAPQDPGLNCRPALLYGSCSPSLSTEPSLGSYLQGGDKGGGSGKPAATRKRLGHRLQLPLLSGVCLMSSGKEGLSQTTRKTLPLALAFCLLGGGPRGNL